MAITKPGESPSAATTRWVHEQLEPEQLATVKITQRYGRRQLSRGMMALIWSLRIYVILMLLLIGYQVWQALQP